jgi:hypothetical protein
MKNRLILFLGIAAFLICVCATKQAVDESKSQTDEDDILVSLIPQNQKLKNLFDKAATAF